MLVEVIRLFKENRPDEAEDLFDLYLPVNRHELRLGISVRKELLRRRGAIATATARYPAQPLRDIDHRELDGLLERLERRSGLPITEMRTG